MLDTHALLSSISPIPHAFRGAAAALVALTALANVTGNQKALFSALSLKLVGPSRNTIAVVVFIGVFRYLERTAAMQDKRAPTTAGRLGVSSASAFASALGILCLSPDSRPALVSLLSTSAASKLFNTSLAKNPHWDYLQPLELLVFMAAGGWIFSSGFFYVESYERSHMKQILKNVVLPQTTASELQTQYRQGFNPNPCTVRHEGRSCVEFARTTFLLRVVARSLRVYSPVHLTAWLLAQRHSKVRARPVTAQMQSFTAKLARSSAYSIGYVYSGWMLCCLLGQLGDRSLAHRKLQFFLSGAIPSLAIIFEAPARRRPIGIILTSYALVSAGNVASRQCSWLQSGGFRRSLLEAGCVAAAMSVTLSSYLESNQLLQRILLGGVVKKKNHDKSASEKVSTTSIVDREL